MRDDRDPAAEDASPPFRTSGRPLAPANLVTDDDTVGFLDAHDAAPDELVASVVAAFDHLALGAVVTVHSRLPDPEAVLSGDEQRITVIGSIVHPAGGTTLTLRRGAHDAPPDPGASAGEPDHVRPPGAA